MLAFLQMGHVCTYVYIYIDNIYIYIYNCNYEPFYIYACSIYTYIHGKRALPKGCCSLKPLGPRKIPLHPGPFGDPRLRGPHSNTLRCRILQSCVGDSTVWMKHICTSKSVQPRLPYRAKRGALSGVNLQAPLPKPRPLAPHPPAS